MATEFPMDRFISMQCFVRAVETGSFSAVARELGTGQPNVSRHIAALEQRLGARLLHRSTRRLTLTPEGERYYAESRRVLDAVDEAEANARGEDAPRGLLRIACPTSLGRPFIVPRIRTLLGRYPGLEIDLQVSDRFIDLVEEGVDLAVRIGNLQDSALKARRVGSAERICVASPAYLRKHGTPKTPEDLKRHNCIIYSLASAGRSWAFRGGQVEVNGRFRVNTPDGIQQVVLDGVGIAYAPVWLFEEAVRNKQAKILLLEHCTLATPINILYSARRLLPRRAAVFMDYLSEEFRRIPSINEGALLRLARN